MTIILDFRPSSEHFPNSHQHLLVQHRRAVLRVSDYHQHLLVQHRHAVLPRYLTTTRTCWCNTVVQCSRYPTNPQHRRAVLWVSDYHQHLLVQHRRAVLRFLGPRSACFPHARRPTSTKSGFRHNFPPKACPQDLKMI